MNTILNIGLGPSQVRPEGTTLGEAMDAIMRTVRTAYVEFVTVSNGEPTLVVVLPHNSGLSVSTLYRLSEKLGQDCIAMLSPVFPNGTLVGPASDKWGQFDVKQFVFPVRQIHF